MGAKLQVSKQLALREEGFTSIGGVRTHWESFGEGPPLVLVHGLGATAASWRQMGPHLAAAGYRTLALDLKGCGLSARPDGDYSRRALASLVLGLMDNLGIRKARALVGHSMGGAIALQIAASRPERVELVAVIDGQEILGSQRLLTAAAPVYPLVGRLAGGVTALAPAAPRRFFAKVYLRRIFGDPERVTPELVESYAVGADAGYHRAMFAMIRHLGDTRQLAIDLRSLSMPALLLWGSADRVCPPLLGEELSRVIPDAELRLIKGCGHVPPEERPEETAALLVDFIARRAARALPPGSVKLQPAPGARAVKAVKKPRRRAR